MRSLEHVILQASAANVRTETPGKCFRGIAEGKLLYQLRECHRKANLIRVTPARCRSQRSEAGTASVPSHGFCFPVSTKEETGLPRVPVSLCDVEHDSWPGGLRLTLGNLRLEMRGEECNRN